MPHDPADSLILGRLKTGDHIQPALVEPGSTTFKDGKERTQAPRMGLDKFLSKFTSDDNASFQEIHEKDRERFQQRIQWMFDESEKYRTLNQLALTNDPSNSNKTVLLGETKEVRTIPALALCDHEPQPNLFFKETNENVERIQEQLKA